jgi:hypothetical protein
LTLPPELRVRDQDTPCDKSRQRIQSLHVLM